MPDAPALQWMTAADLAGACHGTAHALVVDLRDPAFAPLDFLAASTEDLADRARPIAGARHWFLKRRALLRSLMAWRLACSADSVIIAHDPSGVPRLRVPDTRLHLSVAARGAFAACAVADVPVGIDLETIDRATSPVPDVLDAQERTMLHGLSPDEAHRRFLAFWTAKEAYLKACGAGLTRDPATIRIDLSGDDIFIVHDPLHTPPAPTGARRTLRLGVTELACACVQLP